MDKFLDVFFTVFHTCIVIFSLTGWIFPKIRKLHLALAAAIAFSWFVLGIKYGIGYCFLTEWHWRVLWDLGRRDLPRSYIQFLLRRLTGISFNPAAVDIGTATTYGTAVCLSVWLNVNDFRRKRKNRRAPGNGGRNGN